MAIKYLSGDNFPLIAILLTQLWHRKNVELHPKKLRSKQ